MVRPKKFRMIGKKPVIDYFKPRGIPLSELKEINLNHEEYEALRLKDVDNLDQNRCAELMNISQPTFSRILESARKKTSKAIILGNALKIEGGSFKLINRIFLCLGCKHEWDEPFGTGRPMECPRCRSENFHRTNADAENPPGHRGNGLGRRKGMFRQKAD
ncbi:MAG: DUF134 domain-containing protein [Nanoarchaeota archaeon]|nr:DUF134 domain-containing protein [Nanoarchaeota archaeon]